MYFRPWGLRGNTLVCSAVYWFKLYDLPHLRYLIGNPCPACRTYTRIGLLLRGRLVPSQEARLLEILRIAAGSLQDLVETSNRSALGVPTAAPIPGDRAEGAEPLTAPEAGPSAAGAEPSAQDKKGNLGEAEKVSKEGKDKKSKKAHTE